jgi:glycosyltransferase involved in cell wall biosynthesis
MEDSKIAIFHPWIKSRGGAERVVLEMVKELNADLYTWIYEPENTFDEFKNYDIKIIAPKIAKRFSRLKILRGLIFLLSIFKKIPLEKYNKFLISTSGVGEFVTFRNYKKGQTYAYVHTPLREADSKITDWNLENIYKKKPLKKIFYLFAIKIYKILEKKAWKKLDVLIFNSELSRQRAIERKLISTQKNYVVNPIVNLKKIKTQKPENYFIYPSRFNPPKRQDVLLKAWKEFVNKNPKYALIITGTIEGKNYYNELIKLKEKIKNVEIKTKVSDEELENLISKSLAGIFLGYQEDFGIVPLEILSAGKPLIAVNEGGYVDLIKNNPLFFKIKEKHSNKDMIEEVEKRLEDFIKTKHKKAYKEIKTKDFIEEMKQILK